MAGRTVHMEPFSTSAFTDPHLNTCYYKEERRGDTGRGVAGVTRLMQPGCGPTRGVLFCTPLGQAASQGCGCLQGLCNAFSQTAIGFWDPGPWSGGTMWSGVEVPDWHSGLLETDVARADACEAGFGYQGSAGPVSCMRANGDDVCKTPFHGSR